MPDRRLAIFCTLFCIPYTKVKHTLMIDKVFIGAALSVMVLTGCKPNTTVATPTTEHRSNTKIFHKIDPDQPRVEQEIHVVIQAPETITFAHGKIEGLNMYMGYMPVKVTHIDRGKWQTTLYLGACAEPTMHWQVSLPWQAANSTESGVYQFEFMTETN